jgi:hypothetical protein
MKSKKAEQTNKAEQTKIDATEENRISWPKLPNRRWKRHKL